MMQLLFGLTMSSAPLYCLKSLNQNKCQDKSREQEKWYGGIHIIVWLPWYHVCKVRLILIFSSVKEFSFSMNALRKYDCLKENVTENNSTGVGRNDKNPFASVMQTGTVLLMALHMQRGFLFVDGEGCLSDPQVICSCYWWEHETYS